MKKFLLLICFCLLLSGCAGREQIFTVGLCLYNGDHADLREALEQEGYRVLALDARAVQSRQDQQLDQLLREKVELLILEPVMPSGMEEPVRKLQEAGIPTVFVNRKPWDSLLIPGETAYVGWQPEKMGLLQGQLAAALPRGGDRNGDGRLTYVILEGPEDDLVAQQITEGCARGLGSRGDNLAVYAGEWSGAGGKHLCKKALARYGEKVEVIFCGSDAMALGALEAVTDAGLRPGTDVHLISLGGGPEVTRQVALGTLSGAVRASRQVWVSTVVETCRQLGQGKAPGPAVYVELTAITPEVLLENP